MLNMWGEMQSFKRYNKTAFLTGTLQKIWSTQKGSFRVKNKEKYFSALEQSTN